MNCHVTDITRREKFAPVTPEIGTYKLFVCLPLYVGLGVEQRVSLKLRDNVGEDLKIQFDAVIGIKDVRVVFFYLIK